MVRQEPVAAPAGGFEAKVRAELAAADALVEGAGAVLAQGGPFAAVALVKGEPGDADLAAGCALAGPDGDAARKAVAALGYAGPIFATVSRPAPGAAPEAVARRLRLQVEAVEAAIVIALDAAAAADVSAAFGVEELAPGVPVTVPGRTLLAVDDMAASLGDEARKRAVWAQFRSLTDPERTRDATRRPADEALF